MPVWSPPRDPSKGGVGHPWADECVHLLPGLPLSPPSRAQKAEIRNVPGSSSQDKQIRSRQRADGLWAAGGLEEEVAGEQEGAVKVSSGFPLGSLYSSVVPH